MAGMSMKSVFTLTCQNSCDTVRYRTPVYNMNFRERFVASADSVKYQELVSLSPQT